MADRQIIPGVPVCAASASITQAADLAALSFDELQPTQSVVQRPTRIGENTALQSASIWEKVHSRIAERVRERLKEAPSWLLSLMFHVAILIIFWQILLPLARRDFNFDTIVGFGPGDDPGFFDGKGDPFETIEARQGNPALDSDTVVTAGHDRALHPPLLANAQPVLNGVIPAATNFDPTPEPEAVSDSKGDGRGKAARATARKAGGPKEQGADLTGILDGRGEGARARYAKAGGGTKESERAVDLGLEWLARHQQVDGSWTFQHGADEPGLLDCPTGATGLALLCFLGAGNTHKKGEYMSQVNGGIKFLVDHLEVSSSGGWLQGTGQATMYVQGIGAIALCEAYTMSKDPELRRPAQLAVDFIVSAQDPEGGGWRYRIPQAGDTSVVGWQLMALQSARVAELSVPPRCIVRATRFLKSVESEGGAAYAYNNPNSVRPSTTAVGLLCRMYLGREQTHKGLIRGMRHISEWGPNLADMYYSYYATQAMHHWGGPQWERWNNVMRDLLVNSQDQEGDSAGSWPMDASHGVRMGGRLYTTCLSIMTLEVYYRFLPLYRRQALQTGDAEPAKAATERAEAAEQTEAQPKKAR
jgi:hypothetical protein